MIGKHKFVEGSICNANVCDRCDEPRGHPIHSEKVLVATIGLPRSGKSTWARLQGHPIVCPDEIRLALHGQRFVAEAEPFVWAIAKVMVVALFGAGHDVVILDACNTTRKRRDVWQSGDWTTLFHFIVVPVDVCLGRAAAEGDYDLVPIIRRMADQLEPRGDGEQPFEGKSSV